MISAGRLHQAWRALPVGSLDDLLGVGTCLVLAPHPDDESLACGGLIAACCAVSRHPVVAILTDGGGSHPGSRLYPPPRLIARREAEATEAVRILGLPAERLMFLGEPDTRAPDGGPRFEAVVRRLADYVQAFGCSAILAPWQHDPHSDHAAAARIASKTAQVTGIRQLAYPVWGWMLADDAPVEETTVQGWRFDVTAHVADKRRAIAAHASQYGGLITDDPAGFQLPEEFLRMFDDAWETFLLP